MGSNSELFLNRVGTKKEMRSGVYQARTWCGVLRCWDNDEAFVGELEKGRSFEQDLILGVLQPYLQRANVLVDVGAHVGMHTVAYAYLRPHARIFSFEPQARMFELLKENVESNGLQDRVTLHRAAVGHRAGPAELAPVVQDGSHAGEAIEYGTDKRFNLGGLSLGRGGEAVPMIRLDDLSLPGCDFLKIDVEGFEPLVVRGAERLIERFRPVVLFEKNHKQITPEMRAYFGLGDEPIASVEAFLQARGYDIRALPADNFLAVPQAPVS